MISSRRWTLWFWLSTPEMYVFNILEQTTLPNRTALVGMLSMSAPSERLRQKYSKYVIIQKQIVRWVSKVFVSWLLMRPPDTLRSVFHKVLARTCPFCLFRTMSEIGYVYRIDTEVEMLECTSSRRRNSSGRLPGLPSTRGVRRTQPEFNLQHPSITFRDQRRIMNRIVQLYVRGVFFGREYPCHVSRAPSNSHKIRRN